MKGAASVAATGALPVMGVDFEMAKGFSPELIAKVEKIIADSSAKRAKISGCEQILAELRHVGLAWQQHVLPGCCGVHESNRSSFGVDGSDAQDLGAKILKAGWSDTKCADATAFEVPPPPHDASARAFNNELVIS